MHSPVALFVYNRPWHTRQTVESLLANKLASETRLYIFSDGARSSKDESSVNEVREYVKTIKGFNSVELNFSDKNKGLANSIIGGVSSVLSLHETVIVLEDDMVTSPAFLSYMNKALQLYEHEEKVISIHGYVYPIANGLPDFFFLRGADCWGWATWRRGWALFEKDGKKLYDELRSKKLLNDFDFNGTYNFSGMLERQIQGKNDSWAIRWYASAFLNDKLTLYPGKSYVENIGNDGSGTHSRATDDFASSALNEAIPETPIRSVENEAARRAFVGYFASIAVNPVKKVLNALKFLLLKNIRPVK
jgi:hypothetical protein